MASKEELADAAREAAASTEAKYQSLSPMERVAAKPKRDEVLRKHQEAELSLLNEAVLVTDDDVQAMRDLKAEIDAAADQQQFLIAIGKLAVKLAAFA